MLYFRLRRLIFFLENSALCSGDSRGGQGVRLNHLSARPTPIFHYPMKMK